MSAALVGLAEEYQVDYWRILHHDALRESRRLRGNRNHYLPARPLLDYMRRARCTKDQFAEQCGVNKWTVYRWESTRLVSVNTADRVAIALGEHPASVWGADWHAVAALMRDVSMRRKQVTS